MQLLFLLLLDLFHCFLLLFDLLFAELFHVAGELLLIGQLELLEMSLAHPDIVLVLHVEPRVREEVPSGLTILWLPFEHVFQETAQASGLDVLQAIFLQEKVV
jgi:hypothetical protein